MKYETKELLCILGLLAFSILTLILIAVNIDNSSRIDWLEAKNDYYWSLKQQADANNKMLIDSVNNLHDLIESQGWGTVEKTKLGTVIIIKRVDK